MKAFKKNVTTVLLNWSDVLMNTNEQLNKQDSDEDWH